jgi:hypothetical protein
MLSIDDLFKGRHFDQQIIILCVCWYLWFKHVPEFEKRRTRLASRASSSWRVAETYVKVKGRWTYLHRAAEEGKTVDFPLRCRRGQIFLPGRVHELGVALMLGFKRFRHASITIAGIEFMNRIGKGRFQFGKLRIKDNKTPGIWNEVFTA